MCQLFNLIRETLCRRCILVKFCSPSFTLGFMLYINRRNTLILFSQKSSHVDKTKCFLLHIYIHLERCLQILLCLTGRPTALLSCLKEQHPDTGALKDVDSSPRDYLSQWLHPPPPVHGLACDPAFHSQTLALRKGHSKEGQRNNQGAINKWITLKV